MIHHVDGSLVYLTMNANLDIRRKEYSGPLCLIPLDSHKISVRFIIY
jgi:hypothetical protein